MGSKTVVLIGIDGAGKSAIVEGLENELKKKGERCVKVYMGLSRDWALPFLGRIIKTYSHIKRSKIRDGSKNREAMSKNNNYRKRGFGWITVQFIEFWARYLKAKVRARGGTILFDRYFYDGLILSKVEGKSFKFFKKLVPRPDFSYLVYAPPKVIRGRRQEASIEEINEFYKLAEKIMSDFEIKKLDNSGDIKVAIKKVMEDLDGRK